VTAAEIHARTLGVMRFRILGLDLLPLTLGHLRILESLDCYEARDPGELGLACIVCSRPAARVLPFLKSRLLPFRLLVWRLILGRWDFAEKHQAWSDYLRFNQEIPETLREMDGTMPECHVPAHQMIRSRLMSDLNVDYRDIDNYPVLQALWDLLATDVRHRRVTMLDKTASDIEEEMNRIDWARVQKVGEALFNKRQHGSPDPQKQ